MKNNFWKRAAIYWLILSAHVTDAYNRKHGLRPEDPGYKLAKIPKVLRKLAGE
jgi:hypothetical protein